MRHSTSAQTRENTQKSSTEIERGKKKKKKKQTNKKQKKTKQKSEKKIVQLGL
jgi:hypothetical protein